MDMRGQPSPLESVLAMLAVIQQDIAGLKSDSAATKSIIEKEVAGLKYDNAGLRNDMAGLRNDMAGIKNDMAGLRNDMAGLRNDMAGLRNDIVDLKDKTGALSGDLGVLKGEFADFRDHTNTRFTAMDANAFARLINARATKPASPLEPLRTSATNRDIPGFPKTVGDIDSMGGTTLEEALKALEITAGNSIDENRTRLKLALGIVIAQK